MDNLQQVYQNQSTEITKKINPKSVFFVVVFAFITSIIIVITRNKNTTHVSDFSNPQQSSPSKALATPTIKIQPELTKTPAPTIPTPKYKTATTIKSDWQSTTFSFDYPSDWKISGADNPNHPITIESPDYYLDTSEYPSHERGAAIIINIQDHIYKQPQKVKILPDMEISNLYYGPYGPPEKPVHITTVGPKEVVYFKYAEEGSSDTHAFQFLLNNHIISINYHTPTGEYNLNGQIYEKYLSTVWFVINSFRNAQQHFADKEMGIRFNIPDGYYLDTQYHRFDKAINKNVTQISLKNNADPNKRIFIDHGGIYHGKTVYSEEVIYNGAKIKLFAHVAAEQDSPATWETSSQNQIFAYYKNKNNTSDYWLIFFPSYVKNDAVPLNMALAEARSFLSTLYFDK